MSSATQKPSYGKPHLTGGPPKRLEDEVAQWKTPHGLTNPDCWGVGGEFAKQTEHWATPLQGNPSDEAGGNHGGMPLLKQTGQWKTPVVPDGGRHLPPHATETGMVDGVKRQVDLQHQARLWQTPKQPSGGGQQQRTTDGGGLRKLEDMAEFHHSSLPAPTTLKDGDESSPSTPASRQRLNPRFVSWLMGWPLIGGNGSDSLETAWSHWRQRMRSTLSGLVSD